MPGAIATVARVCALPNVAAKSVKSATRQSLWKKKFTLISNRASATAELRCDGSWFRERSVVVGSRRLNFSVRHVT